MTFPLETFDYLRGEPQPSVVRDDSYETILENLNANYAALRAAAGDTWTPTAGDSVFHASQLYAYEEFVFGEYVDARWWAGHPLWAVGADLRRAAQRNLIVPRAGETDEQLRRRIFTDEGEAPFGSLPYVRKIMRDASPRVVNVGLVVTNNNQTFACYFLTDEQDDGTASDSLRTLVQAALDTAAGRHSSQTYTIVQATKVDYQVTAQLLYSRNDPEATTEASMLAAARTSLAAEAKARRNLGYSMTHDDITRALQVPGIRSSTITSPTGDLIPTDESTYYYMTDHTITIVPV